MKLETLNRSRLIRQILPSGFFILLFALYTFSSRLLYVNFITGGILLLLIGNIFLQNKTISRIFGVIFLLGSCYMTLALLDDVFDGEATKGYWVGGFLLIISFIMSVLLIWGYEKQKLGEVKQC